MRSCGVWESAECWVLGAVCCVVYDGVVCGESCVLLYLCTVVMCAVHGILEWVWCLVGAVTGF